MPNASPMIVLFTDFGLHGPYTGQVKAVMRRVAPAAEIIDLFADAPTGNPKAAAYLLATYAAWFPAETIFLCVVDPGVGGRRAPLLVDAEGCRYVGPDNGLFEQVLRRARAPRVWEIAWRPSSLSASFHGRDLFAPVAARLANGDALEATPRAPERRPDWPDDLAEIVYIDHYGNALTGLRARAIPPTAVLAVAPDQVIAHADTFSAVPPGAPFWYANSNGLVEIAVNLGRADHALGLAIGSAVAISV